MISTKKVCSFGQRYQDFNRFRQFFYYLTSIHDIQRRKNPHVIYGRPGFLDGKKSRA